MSHRLTLTWKSFSLIAFFLLGTSSTVRADDVYVYAEEVGADVVFHFEGSIDLTGFPASSSGGILPFIHPANGWFNSGNAPNADSYAGVFPGTASQAFGSGSTTVADSISGDLFGFPNTGTLALPPSYASGTPISGSMTFLGTTLAGLGVDPTPFTFDSVVGSNTVHMFTMPPAPTTPATNLGAARPDLLIGKSPRKLRGDNIYNHRKPKNKQTIVHQRRIFSTNTSKAHLRLQNDSSTNAQMELRSSGDRFPRMKVSAKSGGKNISAAIKSGRFRPNIPAGGSVHVIYRLKTNRYYAGVLRGGNRDDAIHFRLKGGGKKDNAAMINKYR